MKDFDVSIVNRRKFVLAKGVGLACLAYSMLHTSAAFGQAQPEMAAEASESLARKQADVIVTGSRIIRDGYDAPTPTTVLGEAEIAAISPNNIADLVNELPALGTSASPTTEPGQISNGGTGINSLNLRSLGTARTLILLDGKRVPAATLTGLVDVNFLPNALVKRVDIVTGGASASWGSDAVAGVVNFVLDKSFTGIKGEAQGGITTFGDGETYKVSLTGGASFSGGRGHVIVSAEHSYNAGLTGYPRPWYTGAKLINNPNYTATNGQPFYLINNNTGFTTAAPGAIVASGPLRGLYFGPGGVPAQLNYGSIVSDPFMTGGDWQYTDFGNGPQDLDPSNSHQSIFVHASYDVSDTTQAYAQFSYGRTRTSMSSTPQFFFGGLTIQRDNAFLPAAVVTRMAELGLTSLNVGSWNADLGGILTETQREQERYLLGVKGQLSVFGSEWRWDVSANRNVSHILNSAFPLVSARYREAIDAVRNVNGVIVCRSTLTAPNNGCVPYNLLGTGTASEAAKAYVTGNTWVRAKLIQDVFAGSMRGEPFRTWAGAVSLALGVEHRREKISSVTDTLSLTNAYWAGNYKPLNGGFNVTEGFIEAVVPLIERKLDINLAARATDYSSSGYVTTWKVGANFSPIEDIRVRLTKSRDIRAGNLSELYAAGQTQTASINDPFRSNASTTYFQITSGNPNLKPERADTLSAGVVLQPRFLPGLSASVDYFDVNVKDAVTSIAFATILTECFRGDQLLCTQIDRDSAGVLTQIRRSPLNFARQSVRGIDFEIGYRSPIAGGEFSIRALASHYLKAELDNGIDAPSSSLGENRGGIPDWKYRVQATYKTGPISLTAVGRGVSDGVYGNTYIECTTNCPTATAANRTINVNRIAGAFYVDLSARAEISKGIELQFMVDNLANRAPSTAARGTGVGSGPIDVYGYYYDLIGRTFRGGIRFRL